MAPSIEFRLKIAIICLSTQVHRRAPHGFCTRCDLVTDPPDGLLRPDVFVRMGPAGVDPRPVQPEPEVKPELVEFEFPFFASTVPLVTLFCCITAKCHVLFCFAQLLFRFSLFVDLYNKNKEEVFRHGVHLDVVTVASDHFVVGLPVVGRSHLSLRLIPAASGTLKLNASFVFACGQVTVDAVDLRDVDLFPS
jgi:hypothetical protein